MKATKPIARTLLTHPLGLIACGFGAGLSPRAPGTVGSVVALLPGWFLLQQGFLLQGMVIAITFVVGVIAANFVINAIDIQDPSVVVTDEFVGQWLALCLPLWLSVILPTAWKINPATIGSAVHLLVALAAFRLFDVLKPWPISWLDLHLKGGFGAMFDDAVAGVAAGLLSLVILYWL